MGNLAAGARAASGFIAQVRMNVANATAYAPDKQTIHQWTKMKNVFLILIFLKYYQLQNSVELIFWLSFVEKI